MVKGNNGTKMMVNRVMELLNAKIARAQTRHVAKRMPVASLNSPYMDINAMQRERQKCQAYDASKRLSMWEQKQDQGNEVQVGARLDQSHYKHSGLKKRIYDCTWVDFPVRQQTKPQPIFILDEHIPVRRRNCENRPETAKPCDAEASDFLKQMYSSGTQKNRNPHPDCLNSNPKAIQKNFCEKRLSPRQSRFYN
ncbi:uncharacterized protein LOC132786408 [Drosophila nasuta]|uniref:uncharacterized protein LOC132786408 n=1 Tax=Drosophila nasuta TaxID=42062 RepID=UPI00295EC201|nr:uncharacterized protein LOC132786408 [Drosophila nasuta]